MDMEDGIGKSFFKDGKAFEKFSKLSPEDRKRVLDGKEIDTSEVDQIIDDIKNKAKDNWTRKKKEE